MMSACSFKIKYYLTEWLRVHVYQFNNICFYRNLHLANKNNSLILFRIQSSFIKTVYKLDEQWSQKTFCHPLYT